MPTTTAPALRSRVTTALSPASAYVTRLRTTPGGPTTAMLLRFAR